MTRAAASTPRTTHRASTLPTSNGERPTGSLTVVGTGIDVTAQLTPAARSAIAAADAVLHLVVDPLTVRRIEALNPNARTLNDRYARGKNRRLTYEEIVEEVVTRVREGERTCLVLYGHPGFYAFPGHEAIRRLRAEGVPARMVAAVSTLDCLFADLGIDPAEGGMQVYGATYFLGAAPPIDPKATLVLLQVGILGEKGPLPTPEVANRLPALVRLLRERYGAERDAFLYEASPYPGAKPRIIPLPLDRDDPPAAPRLSLLCVPAR
jgi:hypothetical protein